MRPTKLGCGLQGIRLIVTVECTEARGENAAPSRYVTQKVCAPEQRGRQWAIATRCQPQYTRVNPQAGCRQGLTLKGVD
jgi:hypothetical protein